MKLPRMQPQTRAWVFPLGSALSISIGELIYWMGPHGTSASGAWLIGLGIGIMVTFRDKDG